MAKPSFEPTEEEREIVKGLAAYGVPQKQIVNVIRRPKGKSETLFPISLPTLRKYFREELDTAELTANNNVAKALYETAVDRGHKNHVQAAIFWLQARAGWKTQAQVAGTQSVSLDIPPEVLAGLSDAELKGLEKVLQWRSRHEPSAANAA